MFILLASPGLEKNQSLINVSDFNGQMLMKYSTGRPETTGPESGDDFLNLVLIRYFLSTRICLNKIQNSRNYQFRIKM